MTFDPEERPRPPRRRVQRDGSPRPPQPHEAAEGGEEEGFAEEDLAAEEALSLDELSLEELDSAAASLPDPSTWLAPRRAAAEEEYYEDDSLLRNPYVLAGLAVAVAVFLAAVVVVVFGGGGDAGNGGVIIDPLTPEAARGVAARSIAQATVREGPGTEYAAIGTLRSGLDVEVVGRNGASSWFQIYFPVKTNLRGWVPETALRFPEENLGAIPVVAVTPIPRTQPPQPTLPPEPTATETPTPTATGTASPAPDLAVSVLNNNCAAGTDFIVTIRNAGATKIEGRQVTITVTKQGGIVATQSVAVTLEPGAGANFNTGQKVEAPRTSAKVDLLGTPQESNTANNTVDCVVTATPPPIATPTPTATP